MHAVRYIAAGTIIAGLFASTSSATTINGITLTDQNIFRDYRGINDVGVTPGDRLQFGGNVHGGSAGAFGAGIFTPFGSTVPTIIQNLTPCSPLAVNANFCSRSTAFSSNKLNGTWAFEVQKGGATATFTLPPANVIPLAPVPFPSSVTITNSTNGIQPTISWNLPANFTPDAFRVQIYDKSTHQINGVADVIDSVILPNTATSYTFPSVLDSGKTLNIGGQYSINFQMIDTRTGQPAVNNGNADILTRSNSFFDFTPQLASTTPSNVALPQIDVNGVHHFNIDSVGPNSITWIDPAVATGFIYNIGAGDPNFASVILPNVGDGLFDLSFDSTQVSLAAGVQYFFPAGGVSDFTVTGIESSADVDPFDTSAFLTGLTFVTEGHFTGTMTPLLQNSSAVPEPASLALLCTALLGFGLLRRHKA